LPCESIVFDFHDNNRLFKFLFKKKMTDSVYPSFNINSLVFKPITR
jgi:hypothetical protein